MRLADGSRPEAAPGHGPGTYWVAGLVAAVLFFASLLTCSVAITPPVRPKGLDGRIVGLVTSAQARTAPSGDRAARRVRDVSIPLAEVPTVSPSTPVPPCSNASPPRPAGRALVFENGALVGLVTRADVARAVELRTLGARPSVPTVPTT